jgi:flagellar basal body rod protein FlgG
MYSELYSAVSGLSVRKLKLDFLAHNLASLDTVAFKVEQPVFEEWRLRTEVGTLRVPTQVRSFTRWIDFSPGKMHRTGEPLDLAIDGEGFFVIQKEDGIFLTRDGRFSRDEEGRLVFQGMPVLGQDGEIFLGDEPVRISHDGTVEQGGRALGRLRIVRVSSPQQLVPVGEGLYRIPDGVSIEELPGGRVLQGYLEMSNVEPVLMMAEMIDTLRGFEFLHRLIQTVDQLSQRAVQTMGRVA